MDAEVRRVETTVHETGVGVQDRTDVTYELGAVIDGAWVRFTGVTQNQVDAAKAAQPEPEPAPAPQEGPTMEDVTPTPAPQAEAASSGGGTT